MTIKQSLVAHLTHCHGTEWSSQWTHKRLVEWHIADHQHVLPHTHHNEGRTYGFTDGSDQRQVRLVLVKPKNPSSNKAEDRNWTLQVNGHESPWIIQFVRLYGTRDGDGAGAVVAAEQWLGWGHNHLLWATTNGGGYEVRQ